MRTIVTFLAFIAVSLNINAQACCQSQVTTKNIRVGDLGFTIETSYHSVDYAGANRDPFDRVFYLDTDGQKKELPLGEYMWGQARSILNIELLGNELVVNYTSKIAGRNGKATFIFHEGLWKRLVS